MVIDRYASLAVSLSFALACGAQAPITLSAPGNVPVNGTSFIVHKGAYMAPATGGADMLFNFNTATSASSATYQWQDPATLPNSAQFTGAQYALTNGGPDTVYYKATSNGLERVGDAQTIFVGTTPYHGITVYSNSMLELQLPYTYGSTPWTDVFSGAYTVDGNTTTRNGAINGEADAWGRLVMPGGADTVEVVRITTHISENIPLNGGFITVAHVNNVSAFYPLWRKFPVLRVVSDTLSAMGSTLPPITFTEWLDASSVGIAEAGADPFKVMLSPNPANDRVSLGYLNRGQGTLTLHVVDVRGATVLRKELGGRGPAVEVIDVSTWAPGIYQAVLAGAKGVQSAKRIAVVR